MRQINSQNWGTALSRVMGGRLMTVSTDSRPIWHNLVEKVDIAFYLSIPETRIWPLYLVVLSLPQVIAAETRIFQFFTISHKYSFLNILYVIFRYSATNFSIILNFSLFKEALIFYKSDNSMRRYRSCLFIQVTLLYLLCNMGSRSICFASLI